MAMKVFRMESNKKRYCLSVQLSGKTMNYLTILFITVFIAFTLYVQFSRYVFMHNIAKENLLEIYAFHAACTCYVFLIVVAYICWTYGVAGKNSKYMQKGLICWGILLNLWTAFQFGYTLLLLTYFKKGFNVVDCIGVGVTALLDIFYFFFLISYKPIKEAIDIDTSGNPLLYATYSIDYRFSRLVTRIIVGWLIFAIVLGQCLFYVVHFNPKFFPEFIPVGCVVFFFNIWATSCWFRGLAYKQTYLWPLILWTIFLCVWFWAVFVLTYSKTWHRGNIKSLLMFYVLSVLIVILYFATLISYKLEKWRVAQLLDNNRHQPPEPFYPKRDSNHSGKDRNEKRKKSKSQDSIA